MNIIPEQHKFTIETLWENRQFHISDNDKWLWAEQSKQNPYRVLRTFETGHILSHGKWGKSARAAIASKTTKDDSVSMLGQSHGRPFYLESNGKPHMQIRISDNKYERNRIIYRQKMWAYFSDADRELENQSRPLRSYEQSHQSIIFLRRGSSIFFALQNKTRKVKE